MAATLQEIADAIVQRASRQGYVVPREVRTELKEAGLPEDQWKEVIELARPSLNYRKGRYYHVNALSPRLQEVQSQQRLIERAIRRLIRRQQASHARERRQQERADFVQPVIVALENGRQFTLLSRDLSPGGIRLVGTRSLLGQKVRITLPQGDDAETCTFLVRILWTCAMGDDLFENGGTFLEIISP